jgi:hypothetical protein
MERNSLSAMLSVLAALVLAACIQPVEQKFFSGCPCADGWTCCENPNVCVREASQCPASSPLTACAGNACACDQRQCAGGEVCTTVGRCGSIVPGAAQPSKVMLALDRSGSMKTLSTSDTQWGCAADPTGNGYDPAGGCKWNELKALVAGTGGLLDQAGDKVRIGLAVFPDTGASGGDACREGRVEVAVPAAPGAANAQIASMLDRAAPGGGTPSAATLHVIADDVAFMTPDATRFVVLVTDGMPNCDAAIASCQACTNLGDPTKTCGDVRNCLDDAALVSSIQALKARGVDTFVVGFGAGTANPDAARVLGAAADAGGRALSGERKYHQANSMAELEAILGQIRPRLQPCTFSLAAAPEYPDLLVVALVDETGASSVDLLAKGTEWDYTDGEHDRVEIKGATCERIQTAAAGHYELSFLALTEL